METAPQGNDEISAGFSAQPMSKRAQKKLLKQQRYAAKKAEKKALDKEHKKKDAERRKNEWAEKLSSVGQEEKSKLIEERMERRKERMEKRSELKGMKLTRLQEATISGQNIVIDLEFAHLMNPNERNSLVHQIMYSYSFNGRCASPAHIWLTGCRGELQSELQQISGYQKWVIEKEESSYIKVFQDQKENLVYLTADSHNLLSELDSKAIYIIGGLVDRNRWKGITLSKAKEQGIQTAKLPIGEYLKMCSSQVLTVNQVVEILLKFTETKDWKTSFFHVIPLRKRSKTGPCDENDEFETKDTLANVGGEVFEEVEDDQKEETVKGDDLEEVNSQKVKRKFPLT